MICNRKYIADKTIMRWDEALPLGNGDIGALLWGTSDAYRISLDKGDIWDTTRLFENEPNFSYENLQKLVKKGKSRKIRKIFDAPYSKPAPTKLTAGKIIINTHTDKNVESTLDFMNAEASVSFGNVEMNAFISATEKVGMLRFNSENTDIRLQNPVYGTARPSLFQRLKPNRGISGSTMLLHYPSPVFEKKTASFSDGRKYEIQCFEQQTANGFAYCVALGVMKNDGITQAAFAITDTNDGTEYLAAAQRRVTAALKNGYDKTIIAHKSWWNDYFAKSSINLPDKYLENQWYLNNYLLASCSRKGFYPMPLQGLWTADDDNLLPPWKGDYHADLNMQLSYYSYLKAGHTDEGECFIDFLLSLSEKGKDFAKSFFNAKGTCLPAVMDIEGNPLGGWAMYSLSPTNQLWLGNIVAKHFNTIGDEVQIREKAYPYLKDCAEFILSLLNEDENGKLKLPLSSSPEIHDNTLKAWLAPNSNYDQSLLIITFKMLEDWAKKLGYESDRNRWSGISSKLEELNINDNGELMLSSRESLCESHRHHSHAMAIHPLRLLDYDIEADRRTIDATVYQLEKLGTKNWVGYSFAWLAEFYVIQRQGEKAAETLNSFFKYLCSPNGFHLNGDYTDKGLTNLKYRPFTLEGNFCAADALQEMLLYCENNTVEVFRAVPENWKDVSFDNFLGENGISVSSKMSGGRLKYIKISSNLNNVRLKVLNKFGSAFECNLPYRCENGTIYVDIPQKTTAYFKSE